MPRSPRATPAASRCGCSRTRWAAWSRARCALEGPDIWQRLMARDGARLLMLGTPNGGSWAPMQMLSGDDTFGNALVAFGALFDNGGARKMMAGMPGFIQLQAALLDPALGLDKASTWQELADDDMARLRERSVWHDEGRQRAIYDGARRRRPCSTERWRCATGSMRRSTAFGADAQKMLLVVGHDAFTPAGYRARQMTAWSTWTRRRRRRPRAAGPARCCRACAPGRSTPSTASCPMSRVPSPPTSNCWHGATRQLDAAAGAAAPRRAGAGAAAAPRWCPAGRRAAGCSAKPPSSAADVLAGGARRRGGAPRRRPALRSRGAQRRPEVRQRAAARSATTRSARADRQRGRGRRAHRRGHARALSAGLYPTRSACTRSSATCAATPSSRWRWRGPAAVVVAGLGEEGRLRSSDLSYTVRQACWPMRSAWPTAGRRAGRFEMAATLIGSGGAGV